jgi:hypothetical protein
LPPITTDVRTWRIGSSAHKRNSAPSPNQDNNKWTPARIKRLVSLI